jgi:hypothetical protein
MKIGIPRGVLNYFATLDKGTGTDDINHSRYSGHNGVPKPLIIVKTEQTVVRNEIKLALDGTANEHLP